MHLPNRSVIVFLILKTYKCTWFMWCLKHWKYGDYDSLKHIPWTT